MSSPEIVELIEALEAFAEPVRILVRTRPLSPDPNDDMVLDLAINGRADAVITNDIRHFQAALKQFGIPVFTPDEFLARFREDDNHDG